MQGEFDEKVLGPHDFMCACQACQEFWAEAAKEPPRIGWLGFELLEGRMVYTLRDEPGSIRSSNE
jgi:hypothetical protein